MEIRQNISYRYLLRFYTAWDAGIYPEYRENQLIWLSSILYE